MEKPEIANALIQRVINELKKEWIKLTDEEIDDAMPYAYSEFDKNEYRDFAKAIESKSKEKNL